MSEFLWRLEGPDHDGIYQDLHIMSRNSVYRHGDNDKRPGPGRDNIPRKYQGKFFGGFLLPDSGANFAFPTVEAARAWFDHKADLTKWTHKGAKLVAIPCDRARDVFVTPHQAVYFPKGKPVLELPADSLYALTPEQLETRAKEANYAVV